MLSLRDERLSEEYWGVDPEDYQTEAHHNRLMGATKRRNDMDNFDKYIDDNWELIKQDITGNPSKKDLDKFKAICKKSKLNPLTRQIYLVPRGGTFTPQTSIEGFRVIAERTGRYAPGKDPYYTYDAKNNLTKATAYVKKMTADGTWHEVSACAHMNEYKSSGPFWNNKPHIMLAKCAESQALRRAFPDECAGLYTKEEMNSEGENGVETKNDHHRAFENVEDDFTFEEVPHPIITNDQLQYALQKVEEYPELKEVLRKHLSITDIREMKQDGFMRMERWIAKKEKTQSQKEAVNE